MNRGGEYAGDAARKTGSRYLYAIHADAQKLFGWAVGQSGQLTPVGEFGGVPDTVAGLAADSGGPGSAKFLIRGNSLSRAARLAVGRIWIRGRPHWKHTL
jgi:hypothetical protein